MKTHIRMDISCDISDKSGWSPVDHCSWYAEVAMTIDLPFVPPPQLVLELPRKNPEGKIAAQLRRSRASGVRAAGQIRCHRVRYDATRQELRIYDSCAFRTPFEVREAVFQFTYLFGFSGRHDFHRTAVVRSAAAGDVAGLQEVLREKEAEPEWLESVWPDALEAAAREAQPDMVECLLQALPGRRSRDADWIARACSAARCACARRGDRALLDVLLKAGADADTGQGEVVEALTAPSELALPAETKEEQADGPPALP